MASLQEILADRSAYPDDREITMPDGAGSMTKLTVGELRNQLMPKSDFTKEVNRMSQEKSQLDQQYRQSLGQFQQQLQAMNQQLAARNQAPVRTQEEFEERLEADINDPTLGPYVKTIRRMSKTLNELQQEREETKQRLAQHEQAFWLNQHSQVLAKIQRDDEEYRTPEKTQELIQYAQQHGLSNLDLAYQLKTRDRDIERAKEKAAKDAESRAAEQAKVNGAQPHIPAGSKAASPAAQGGWQPSKDSLDPFEEAASAAQGDADLEVIGAKWAAEYSGR